MPPPPPPTTKPRPPTTSTSKTKPTPRPRSPETHQSLANRNAAVEVLQSYEQLSWHALNRNESLAQTRLHFLSILAGFTKEDEAAQVDWKTDSTPHQLGVLPRSVYTGFEPLGGDGRRETSASGGRGKGKARASLGGSGSAGRASPAGGRASLGGEGSVGGSGRKKRRSEGVGQ